MTNASLSQLAAEFKANPRLRAGVWAILAIVWFYGVLHIQEAAEAKAKEYETVAKRLARTQAAAEQKDWHERAEAARLLEQEASGRLWQEKTQGLAQAAFQDWLAQTLQQAAIARPQMSVAAQDGPRQGAEGGDLWKVSARVAFDFNPKTFAALLDRISRHEKQVAVETLNVRSVPSPRVEIMLVAYFSKAAAP